MNRFKKILYLCDVHNNDVHAAKQALSLTRNCQGLLSVWVSVPTLPSGLASYNEVLQKALLDRAKQQITLCCNELDIASSDITINFQLLTSTHIAIDVVHQVINHHYDLVVKAADTADKSGHNQKGYSALDMALLRKCPVPVWLCRPIIQHRDSIKVAVAVDPTEDESKAQQLNHALINLGNELVKDCDGTLNIVSCWEFELETVLSNSLWLNIANDDLEPHINQANTLHKQSLDALLNSLTTRPDSVIHRLKGAPHKQIPAFVEEHDIDIIIMGTVARTGIPGLMIGNTAESILSQLSCTLLAVKPEGFVSPVSG